VLRYASGVTGLGELDRDHIPPEDTSPLCSRWPGAIPIPGEGAEDLLSCRSSDSASAVLWHHQELGDGVRWSLADERHAGDDAVHGDDEWVPVGFRPVVVEVPIAESSMSIEVGAVEALRLMTVCEVVLVEVG
jgi:hypothetical protein